jgi:hypothetical protein
VCCVRERLKVMLKAFVLSTIKENLIDRSRREVGLYEANASISVNGK